MHRSNSDSLQFFEGASFGSLRGTFGGIVSACLRQPEKSS